MSTSVTPAIGNRAPIELSRFNNVFELAITGAFLTLVANGAGALSLDHRRAR